jgi:hypothetical protein
MSLLDRVRSVAGAIQAAPAKRATAVSIPRDHVDGGESEPQPFAADEHYFQVRVNELYLANGRQWFARFDPMVMVVSEFVYDKKVQAVPTIVGPEMLKKYGQELPSGLLLRDTRVAGVHPYKGGRLSLTVVLSQVQTENYAREVLRVVESAAGLAFATGLGTYLQVTGVVLDGLEALVGIKATSPIVGLRKEFDPDFGDRFEPGYFALVDVPEDSFDPATLWVRNGRLHVGSSLEDARPFDAADFVLYSIGQDDATSELQILPFYPLWERVLAAATHAGARTDDPNWESAKSDMRSLYQTLMLSPDLTTRQAEELTDTYIRQAQALRERSKRITTMAPPAPPSPDELKVDEVRSHLAGVLAD